MARLTRKRIRQQKIMQCKDKPSKSIFKKYFWHFIGLIMVGHMGLIIGTMLFVGYMGGSLGAVGVSGFLIMVIPNFIVSFLEVTCKNCGHTAMGGKFDTYKQDEFSPLVYYKCPNCNYG